MDPNGCKVTLNAVNIFPGWAAPHYRSIRAKGFNAIRLLLPWRTYEPARGQLANLDQIDTAVRRARAADLYVVIDTFLTDAWNNPPGWATVADPRHDEFGPHPEVVKLAQIEAHGRGYLQELVRRYRGNPVVAGYDLVGEAPSISQNSLLRLYSNLIDWVRVVDPDKIVLIEAGWGNSSMTPRRADAANLRHARNVVHSWHDYFAGDGNPDRVFEGYNEWGLNGGNQTWEGVLGYPNPGDRADFEAQVLHQADFGLRAGVPIWVGEQSINPAAENAAAFMEQKTAIYRKYGLGRAWWLYTCGEHFGLKDESCRWRYTADRLGLND